MQHNDSIFVHINMLQDDHHNNCDFPNSPVVKTSHNAGGAGLIPALGVKIPHFDMDHCGQKTNT